MNRRRDDRPLTERSTVVSAATGPLAKQLIVVIGGGGTLVG